MSTTGANSSDASGMASVKSADNMLESGRGGGALEVQLRTRDQTRAVFRQVMGPRVADNGRCTPRPMRGGGA